MARKFLLTTFIIFFVLFVATSYAAELIAKLEDKKVEYVFLFQKGYSAFDRLFDETRNIYIFTFDTSEDIEFEKQNYFNNPIQSAYLTSKDKKRFFVEFRSTPIEPIINQSDRQISIVFPFPEDMNIMENIVGESSSTPPPAIPSTSNYVKMIFGLIFVLILIFLLFFILKIFFKKQLFSDIPGTGRLLGKVDLDLRKSIYFYEIGDIIYLLGITESGMNVIDKVIDEIEADKIRSGFIKKNDFKGYMAFFKRKEKLDEDLSSSSAMVEEKLKAIRNRKKNL